MQQDKLFKMHANCVKIRGASRSSILDLQHGTLHLIPNSLFEILDLYEGRSFQSIKQDYNHEFDDVIDEYWQFLLENDLIFFSSDFSPFTELSLDWYDPSVITNCIIDVDIESDFSIESIIGQLDILDCKSLQLRAFGKFSLNQYQQWLSYAKYSTITSIELLIPYDSGIEGEALKIFCDSNKRLTSLTIHSSNEERKIYSERYNVPIVYTSRVISDETCCGVITMENFSINQSTFTESLQYNTCLNRKISVDKFGNIKNCPSMRQAFGNIRKSSLVDALSTHGFRKTWLAKKDDISICKVCEFRYVCTDCRAYLEKPEDQYSKPLKCGYDPYTCSWKDWNSDSSKREAIEHYKLREMPSSNK